MVLKQQFRTSVNEWNRVFGVLCIISRWLLDSRDRIREAAALREAKMTEDLERSLRQCGK